MRECKDVSLANSIQVWYTPEHLQALAGLVWNRVLLSGLGLDTAHKR